MDTNDNSNTHSMEKMNEELNKIKADKYRAIQSFEIDKSIIFVFIKSTF